MAVIVPPVPPSIYILGGKPWGVLPNILGRLLRRAQLSICGKHWHLFPVTKKQMCSPQQEKTTLISQTRWLYPSTTWSTLTWTWAAQHGHLWCPLQETGAKVRCFQWSSTSGESLLLHPGQMQNGFPWSLLPNTQSLWSPPTGAGEQKNTMLS